MHSFPMPLQYAAELKDNTFVLHKYMKILINTINAYK